jgi:hypothetical protein
MVLGGRLGSLGSSPRHHRGRRLRKPVGSTSAGRTVVVVAAVVVAAVVGRISSEAGSRARCSWRLRVAQPGLGRRRPQPRHRSIVVRPLAASPVSVGPGSPAGENAFAFRPDTRIEPGRYSHTRRARPSPERRLPPVPARGVGDTWQGPRKRGDEEDGHGFNFEACGPVTLQGVGQVNIYFVSPHPIAAQTNRAHTFPSGPDSFGDLAPTK